MRPFRAQTLMDVAEVIARRSSCSRASVGAVIARDGRILASGYNGTPAGMAHCDHTCNCGLKGSMPFVPPEAHKPSCPANLVCTQAVHAETNAIAWAARDGVSTSSSEIYSTVLPCLRCAQLIISAGIRAVYYRTDYRDYDGLILLTRAQLSVTKI